MTSGRGIEFRPCLAPRGLTPRGLPALALLKIDDGLQSQLVLVPLATCDQPVDVAFDREPGFFAGLVIDHRIGAARRLDGVRYSHRIGKKSRLHRLTCLGVKPGDADLFHRRVFARRKSTLERSCVNESRSLIGASKRQTSEECIFSAARSGSPRQRLMATSAIRRRRAWRRRGSACLPAIAARRFRARERHNSCR